ncbi:hypothetical protein TEA_015758 [Camellia sinensis var. sinensis]|uniref:F-box domain-containing protein n=1 Tax=Camellia sinensis var. sinensis TaxID=542762 RepID=A0A4S4EFH0_CAMSN|nr:hypothetical protein TEA_015758 [Camellia sinensis var. sinensis]
MMKQIIPNKKNKHSIPKELPTQIILEILSRLPIKTLFLCQLVSKHWLSLISDPHFAKLHLSRSQVNLLIKPKYRSSLLRLVDLQILHKIHPLDAQLKFIPKIHFPSLGSQLLQCPKTNQYKVIRFFNQRFVEFFDPTIKNFVASFFNPLTEELDDSFDPITELRTSREEAKAIIYTIGEGSWRNMGSVPYFLTNHSFNSFVNGALHWLNFARDSPDFIICFDFGSEQFRVVPEPPEFGLHRKEFPDHIRVGVLRDSLSICDFSNPRRIDIWLMKDYGIKESWSKELVIENGIGKRGNLDRHEPIMILKSGEILMLVNKDALKMYNPKLVPKSTPQFSNTKQSPLAMVCFVCPVFLTPFTYAIRFWVFDPINQAKAMIYTIGEGSWRDIGIAPYYLTNCSVNSFLNGFFIGLLSPKIVPNSFVVLILGLSNFGLFLNLLSVVCLGRILWVFKEFVIGNVTGKRGYGDYYETIMILKNGKILMLVNKGVLVLYSPKEGRVEKLNIDGININPAFYGTAHIPSFVSLKDVAKGESLKVFSSYVAIGMEM